MKPGWDLKAYSVLSLAYKDDQDTAKVQYQA